MQASMEIVNIRMFHPLGKILKPLFLLLLSVALLSGTSAAQSEKEIKVMRMFYKETDLFSSVTRNPKPISQIAENVTVVTAKQIETMNAHSVAEVLNRVTGLFVNFSQGVGSFGSTSLLHVQGSEDRHVLVMVDGIAWNSMAGGSAETNTIPVGIIDRIEIIKGPASSSWGSSLGGVVHIITKSPGYSAGPDGSMQAAYGEHDSQDYRAELSGRTGRFGYYLFGGRQASDGLYDARQFETESYYSKLFYTVSNKVELGLSFGYSQPETGLGDYAAIDLNSSGSNRNFWGTAILDAALTRKLTFNLRLFRFEQESTITNKALGLGFIGSKGDLYQKSIYDEETSGGTAKLVWKKENHTAVIGMDFSHGRLDQTIASGPLLQSFGAPGQLRTDPVVDKTGIYINDTIVLDRFSITPGLRYDYNSITGSFLSPSLGLTYRLGAETIVRGSVARGFMAPPLSWTSGGALFLDPNASLEEEKVWSYQAGLESTAIRYVWLKGTIFRHEIDDIFVMDLPDAGAQTFNTRFINNDISRRQGIELEAETFPVYHLSLKAGFAYVNLNPENDSGANDVYACNIGLTYDDPRIVRAELFGHYIWWDARAYPDAEYDAFVWDLNVSRKLCETEKIVIDLFFTGHNLFNGSQYQFNDNKNPDRWFEAGLRMDF